MDVVLKKPPNQYMPRDMSDVQYLAYLFSRCKQSATGCLEFQGGKNAKGYGQITVRGRRWMSHRFAYAMTKGAIPEGYLVLHSCDNPACCNPAHLNVGTMVDNAQDSADKMRHFNGRKTHCKHGHEFTPENTVVRAVKDRPGLFRRQCLECQRTIHAGEWSKRTPEQKARIYAKRNARRLEKSQQASQ